MDILMTGIALILLALIVAWMAETHELIWKWIKTQVVSLYHLVSALLQIVVKKIVHDPIKWLLIKLEDWLK